VQRGLRDHLWNEGEEEGGGGGCGLERVGWAGGEVQKLEVDERVEFGEGNIMSVHCNLQTLTVEPPIMDPPTSGYNGHWLWYQLKLLQS